MIEFAAAQFLKWEKRCPLVLWERSPRTWHAGEPDVLGITESRYMLEVEVKRSASDFRANMNKRHMRNRFCDEQSIRSLYHSKAPRQFWFAMPVKLAEKLRDEIPDWAGLMVPHGNGQTAIVLKPAPTNKESQKLDFKECTRLMRCAGNQIISLMKENCYHRVQGTEANDSTFMDDYYSKVPEWYSAIVPNSDYLNFQI